MSNRRSVAACAALVFLVMTSDLAAQQGKAAQHGKTAQQDRRDSHHVPVPIPRPLRQIQAQLEAINQRILALQAQINSVQSTLQAQIDSINASFAALQGWVTSVDDAVTSINGRIDANYAMIGALDNSIGALQASLAAIQVELADTTEADAIQALQVQAGQLQLLINQHTAQAAGLQEQVSSANAFLANMANATCSVGQAISDIQPFGQITCMTPSGGGVQVLGAQFVWAFGPGAHTFVVNCPLGFKAAGGGYDGAVGVTVTGSFPNASSHVVRVQSALASASIQALVRCVQ